MSSHSQGWDVVFVYYDTFDMMACVMDYWPAVPPEYSENALFEDNTSHVLFYFPLYQCPLPSPFSFNRYLNHAEADRAAQLDFSHV